MMRYIAGTLIAFSSSILLAAPIKPPPAPPVPPSNTIQCDNIAESGKTELQQRIFIGSEFADSQCVLARNFVPAFSEGPEATLSVDRQPESSDVVTVSIDRNEESAWLSECFFPASEKRALSAYHGRTREFVQDRHLIHRLCTGKAEPGTLNGYNFKVRLSRVPDSGERLILASWKGMPDLYRHTMGGAYQPSLWLKDQVNYVSVVAAGATFETTGFDPLTLEIREGFLALIARSDSSPLTTEDTCDFQSISELEAGHSSECGEQRQVTLVAKIPVEEVFNGTSGWVPMRIRVAWSKYQGLYPVSGRVQFFIDRQLKESWSGNIGRNDNIGPYLTIGAGGENVTNPIEVSYQNLNVRHNIVGLNVNLIRNPSNYGRFDRSWKALTPARSRSLPAFLHNRVSWGDGGNGYFATPYYTVSRVQTIDLKDFFASRRSNKPITLVVGEQFNKTYCGGDIYQLKVRLLDEGRNVIGEWGTGNRKVNGPCEWTDEEWLTVKHELPLEGKEPRYIEFIDGGRDKERWAGYYGSRMREATVVLEN
ncbi:MAG: hypothetical protein ACR2PT_17985 [Endozoicomonas sp.]